METFDEDKLPDDELGQLVNRLAERIEARNYPARAWPVRLSPKRVRPWVAVLATTVATAAAAAMILCTWFWTHPADPYDPGVNIASNCPAPGTNSPAPQPVPLAADIELPAASLDPCLLGAPSEDLAAAVLPTGYEPPAPAQDDKTNPKR
jgi:hypothetical protein